MSSHNSPANGTGTTLPDNRFPFPAEAHRDLPCYTIIVHGVNDVGECYEAVERGLCEGLNERLDRKDLQPAHYTLPTEKDRKQVIPDPDALFYQRKPVTGTWSPVIPFYWGFREEELQVRKHERHGQWTDRFGNRLDRNRSKGGGPFANATNSIPDMFGPGFKEAGLAGTSKDGVSQTLGGSATHALLSAPPRDYNLLAALRLAMLIAIIRNRHAQNQLPEPTINIVAHSQGTMVTLLAHALLAKEGKRGADATILCNTTYCLRGMGKLGWTTKAGEPAQTPEARLQTFRNILDHMLGAPVQTPSFLTLSTEGREQLGLAGERWRHSVLVEGEAKAYPDRDNRGTVMLYFCPEVHTVALGNIQGIGWCGVENDHLRQLPAGFGQRIWTVRWRNGHPCLVGGAPCSYPLLVDGEECWDWSDDASGRAEFDIGESRWISEVTLPVSFEPQLRYGETHALEDGKRGHQGSLPVDPVTAAVAASYKGSGGYHRGTQTLPPQEIEDPRAERSRIPPNEEVDRIGTQPSRAAKIRQLQQLQALFDARLRKKDARGEEDRSDQFEVQDAWSLPNGRLMLVRSETGNEARLRWQGQSEKNSYHSAIVTNPMHHKRATAYDIAVGIGSGSDPKVADTLVKRRADDEAFLKYLCRVADWRLKEGDARKLLKEMTFYKKERGAFSHGLLFKTIINATTCYFSTGQIEPDLLPKLTTLSPIVVSSV